MTDTGMLHGTLMMQVTVCHVLCKVSCSAQVLLSYWQSSDAVRCYAVLQLVCHVSPVQAFFLVSSLQSAKQLG